MTPEREDAPGELPLVGERFCLLEPVRGGGRRAYDTRLRREVVLRRVDVSAAAYDAVISGAQGLAKLSHPNLVAVYDVIVAANHVVIATEWISGQTLREWLPQHRVRRWHAVLALLIGAGHALAAAHRVGLFHGDISADKLLVVDGERVIVSEFAALTGRANAHDPSALQDQWAFCATVWEALGGSMPQRRVWPRHVRVPARVVAALRRGLAPEPAARWPDMAALLAELATAGNAARRSSFIIAGALPVLIVAGGLAASWQATRADLCTGADEHLTYLRNVELREQMSSAFARSALPYATQTLAQVLEEIDAYAAAWADQHRESCRATAVRGEQSQAVMDLRMGCLHRRKLALRSTFDVLTRADAQVVERAAQMVASMPALSTCADVEALQTEIPPPEDEHSAVAVARVRELLAQVVALEHGGKYADAAAVLDVAQAVVDDTSYAPVHVEFDLRRGSVAQKQGHFAAAQQALERALVAALHSSTTADAVEALVNLTMSIGHRQARWSEGLRLGMLALHLGQQTSGRSAPHEADARTVLAIVHYSRGDYSRAETEFRRALALRLESLGPEHLMVAAARNNLGNALQVQGELVEAEAQHRQALELRVKLLGAEHPLVGDSRNNLANVLSTRGDDAQAEVELRAALEIYARSYGSDHPKNGEARSNLALSLAAQKRYDEAVREHAAALSAYRNSLPADHPLIADSLVYLAETCEAAGRHAEALDSYLDALESYIEHGGPSSPSAVVVRSRVARVLTELGREDEAAEHLERAWEDMDASATSPGERAQIGFALAKLLWRKPSEQQRSLELARAAELAARDAEGTSTQLHDEVAQWLTERIPARR